MSQSLQTIKHNLWIGIHFSTEVTFSARPCPTIMRPTKEHTTYMSLDSNKVFQCEVPLVQPFYTLYLHEEKFLTLSYIIVYDICMQGKCQMVLKYESILIKVHNHFTGQTITINNLTLTSNTPPNAILNSPFMSLANTLWNVCLNKDVLKESAITIWPLKTEEQIYYYYNSL